MLTTTSPQQLRYAGSARPVVSVVPAGAAMSTGTWRTDVAGRSRAEHLCDSVPSIHVVFPAIEASVGHKSTNTRPTRRGAPPH
jgi:hypothetical protein